MMIRIRGMRTVGGAVLCTRIYARTSSNSHNDPTRQVAYSHPQFTGQKNGEAQDG